MNDLRAQLPRLNLIKSRPSGIIVPLIYSELFGSVPTRRELEEFVGEINWRTVVMWVAGILSVSWQDGVESSDQHYHLVTAMTKDLLYGPAIESMLAAEPNRILFSREALLAVLRVAVAEGSSGNATLRDYSGPFIRAILAANELLAIEIMPTAQSKTAVDLLPSELRSAILQLENPHDLLARADALFVWSETDKAKASRNYLPLAADFERFTGLTPVEFLTGAYFTFARYASMQNWSDVERLGVAFSIAQWQAGMADTRVIRQWFAVNSIGLDLVRQEWKAETSLSVAAAGSLWRRPIVKVEDDLFFVPAPALVANTMGDGIYYTLMDGYRDSAGDGARSRKEAVARFTRFFGEFFEDHVAELLLRAYANRADARVSREVEYRTGVKSSDIIISEGNDIIFIEVVAKRMNLQESVLRLNPAAIAGDLEAAVIRKARQLDRNIRDFREGVLLPDFPRSPSQRIFPVVISPRDLPRVNVITMLIESAMQQEGLLAGTEPLELLDLGEIEQLENGLVAGISLAALLERKNRSTRHNRMMSLHNYFIYIEPGTLPQEMSPTRRAGSEFAKRIMALAQDWVSRS